MQQSQTWSRTVPVFGLSIILALLFFNLSVRPVAAAGIEVNSNADTLADDGECTLREAIIAANTDTTSGVTAGECATSGGDDTITFSTNEVITLSSQLPAVTTKITISGNGADQTIIQASVCNPVTLPNDCTPAAYRVMEVGDAGTLFLDGVTVRHGYVDNKLLRTGAVSTSDGGAGIYSAGVLGIGNSTLADNKAVFANGGGINSTGLLVVSKSTFSGNSGLGGGGLNHHGSPLSVDDSTFVDNASGTGGGGAINADTLSLTGSTIAANLSETGAGIYGHTVTVAESNVTGNMASELGHAGGIWGTDSVTVINSIIEGNSAGNDGGGILANTVNVFGSTITGNFGRTGGGINGTEVTMTGSTVFGNVAEFGFGGGVYSDAKLKVTNSTFSANSASYGGAIYHVGTLTLTNNTITDNSAAELAGGVYIDGEMTLLRNVIAGNNSDDGAEVYSATSPLTSDGHNVYSHDQLTTAEAFEFFTPGATDINASSDAAAIFLEAILDPLLADNGGPTMTHALVMNSPAKDIADAADCAGPPVDGVDQRGVARPQFAGCDAGSFELEPGVGTIQIVKVANPADDKVFNYTDNIASPNSFTLQDPSNATIAFVDIPADESYTVTELDTPGWPLTALSCNNTTSSDYTTSLTNGFVTIDRLAADDVVTCTFTSTMCQPGNYDDGGNECVAAETGHYVPAAAATEAIPCSPGSYQPDTGQDSCLLADPGFYVDISGSDKQFACPAGTTSGPGATACTPIGIIVYLPVVMGD